MSGSPDADFLAFEEARRTRAAGFFTGPATLARAPGRLDVMGGIADYSGCLVAEMPIAQAAIAGAQVGGTEGGDVIVRSLNAEDEGLQPEVVLPGELFVNPVSLLRWEKDAPKSQAWAAYVAGSVAILRAEGLLPRKVGAKLLVRSGVPLGAGLKKGCIKRSRETLLQGHDLALAVQVFQYQFHIATELPQDLAAGATRRSGIFGISHHRNAFQLAGTFGNGL